MPCLLDVWLSLSGWFCPDVAISGISRRHFSRGLARMDQEAARSPLLGALMCALHVHRARRQRAPWEKSSSHRFGHQESSPPPWHQSRVDQCGSRTGRRDLPMVVVEFNRGAGSDAVVALDARVRGASLERGLRGDNGDED